MCYNPKTRWETLQINLFSNFNIITITLNHYLLLNFALLLLPYHYSFPIVLP
jgi:hypothetical protein